MLLIEQMKTTHFSHAEQSLVQYMIEHPEKLDQLTTTHFAEITHTNPTSLIRVAKKLGYKGWTDLRTAYLDEWLYLNSHYKPLTPTVLCQNDS